MPFKPTFRPFKPPPLRTPSFLPEPIYAESEIPEADPGLQGPPPALQSPEVRINAPAPPKQKTFSERFREIQSEQPEPITGFRRGASAFLSGGIPGLAAELINPSVKRERHQMNVDNLIAEQKVNSQERQDETNDMYKRSLADDIAARGAERKERLADADLNRERMIANDEWEEYSGPPEMSAPGEQPMFQYATIGGRKMRRPSEFAKQKAKRDAELSTHREVPPDIAQKLRLTPGTKVAPNELDGYVRMVEAQAAREQNEQMRRDLAHEANETRKLIAGIAASSRQGGSGGSQPSAALSPTAQGVLDGSVVYHGLNSKDKSAVRNELLRSNVGWREPVKLTPQQDGAIKAMNTIDAMIGKLENVYSTDKDIGGVGPAAGSSAGQFLNETFGLGSDSGVTNRSVLGGISAELLHEKYGSALSKGEQERARSFIPSATDRPRVVIEKLRALRDFHDAKRAEWGVGPKKPNGGEKAPTASVRMVSPDGKKDAMVKPGKIADAEKLGWKRVDQ